MGVTEAPDGLRVRVHDRRAVTKDEEAALEKERTQFIMSYTMQARLSCPAQPCQVASFGACRHTGWAQ